MHWTISQETQISATVARDILWRSQSPRTVKFYSLSRSAILTKSDAVWTCLVLIAMGLKSKSILFKQTKSAQPLGLIWIGLPPSLPADYLPSSYAEIYGNFIGFLSYRILQVMKLSPLHETTWLSCWLNVKEQRPRQRVTVHEFDMKLGPSSL